MVSEGEGPVSALASRVSRLACTLTLARWPQVGSLPRAIFRPSRAQPLCLVLVDPTDGVLEDRGNPFSYAHKMKTTTCLPDPSLLLVLFRYLSPLSRSSHGRVLLPHGQARNHGRGADRSGRIKQL